MVESLPALCNGETTRLALVEFEREAHREAQNGGES